jgi:O-antigen/teichoic acid export membrane protein
MIQVWLGMDFPLLVLMLIVFFVQPAYNFWVARQRYELKYKTTVIWTVVCALAPSIIAILCICFSDSNKLYARLFGAELTLVFIYLGFCVYLAIKSNFKVNLKYWKSALCFNLPLIPHYLSTYLLGSSDKLMISSIVGDAATAYYSVAYSVAAVVTIVWTSVNSSLVPYTYEKCKTKNYKAISAVTLPILTAFAVMCGAAIMLAPEIVSVMATKDYMEAIYVIPPVVGGVFFQVHYYIYANVVYYYKQTKYVMYASVCATVLNLVLNYIFIYRFGYIAAGYTTLVCYFVQAVLDYFAMKKVVGKSIYDMKYVGGLSMVLIIVSLISVFIYNYALVRYAIIFVMIVLAFMFRKRIISIIINLKDIKKKI